MCVFCSFFVIFFFKQKTAYEMRISDWSSDVCSSDLLAEPRLHALEPRPGAGAQQVAERRPCREKKQRSTRRRRDHGIERAEPLPEEEASGDGDRKSVV